MLFYYVFRNTLLLQNKNAVLAPGSGNYGTYPDPELCFEVQEIPVFPQKPNYIYPVLRSLFDPWTRIRDPE